MSFSKESFLDFFLQELQKSNFSFQDLSLRNPSNLTDFFSHIFADHNRSLPAAHHGEVCNIITSSVGSYRSHHITISSSFTDTFLPSWSHSTSIRLALRRLCYRRYLIAGMYPSEVHTFLIWQVRGDGGFGKVKRLCG